MIYSRNRTMNVPYHEFTSGNPGVPGFRSYTLANAMNGTDKQNWKQLIKEGSNATNTMSATKQDIELYTALAILKTIAFNTGPTKSSTVGVTGFPAVLYRPPYNLFSFDLNQIQSDCSAVFANRVHDRIKQMSGPEFILELGETLRMLRRPSLAINRLTELYATKARRITAAARQKSKRKRTTRRERANERLDQLNDLYLEYRFGVEPLLSDVKSAAEVLAQLTLSKEKRVSAKVQYETGTIARALRASGTLGLNTSWQHYATSKGTISCMTKGAIRAEFIAPRGPIEEVLRGTGLIDADFLPTIWNWIPFSFILDYFANVNDVLIGSYATSAYTAWSSQTSRIMVLTDGSFESKDYANVPDPSSQKLASSLYIPGQYQTVAKMVIRKVDPADVQLRLEAPGQKQCFNILALIRSFSRNL